MKLIITTAWLLGTVTPVCGMDIPNGSRASSQIHPLVSPVKPSGHQQNMLQWCNEMKKLWDKNHPVIRRMMTNSDGTFKHPSNFSEARILNTEIQKLVTLQDHIPDRSNLRSRASHIQSEFDAGDHQLHDFSEDDAALIEQMQANLNRMREHIRRNQADSKLPPLHSYLMLYAPSAGSSVEVNKTFLRIIHSARSALDNLDDALAEIDTSSLKITHSKILSGLRTVRLPSAIGSCDLISSEYSESQDPEDFQSFQTYLQSHARNDFGLAYRVSQKGTPGLTILEKLIGGFEFDSDNPMYPQEPSLFNVLVQIEISDEVFNRLIKIHETLTRFYLAITAIPQQRIEEASLERVTNNDSARLSRADKVNAAIALARTDMLSYSQISHNLAVWQENLVYNSIASLKSADDFRAAAQLYTDKLETLDVRKAELSKLKEAFLSRDGRLFNLIKLINQLSSKKVSFNNDESTLFGSKLTKILDGSVEVSTPEELGTTFSKFFKQSENLENLVNNLVSLVQIKQEIMANKFTSELIVRINYARQQHQKFVGVLDTIAARYPEMKFNLPVDDMGKQKTVFYLGQIAALYKTQTYLTLPSLDRSNHYSHALKMLQDASIWESNSDQWVDLFKRAHESYLAARSALTQIGLPTGTGTATPLPIFDFSSPLGSSSAETDGRQRGAPFMPPPAFGQETWSKFIRLVTDFANMDTSKKDLIRQILVQFLADAQSFADCDAPQIPQIRDEFIKNNIEIPRS